jgi:hypothetical protein
MSKTTTYADQSVFDIALQATGSVEGVFDLLKANTGLQLDSHIAPGTILQLPGEAVKQEIVDYYFKNNIKPATGNIAGLPEYKKEEEMIKVQYNYDLAGGSKALEGVRLYNLNGNMTVQINYEALNADDVSVSLEMSLDGFNYSAIPEASYQLDKSLQSHSFIFYGFWTSYIRLKVDVGSATAGKITDMLIQL